MENSSNTFHYDRRGAGVKERSKVKLQEKINEKAYQRSNDAIEELKRKLLGHASLAFPELLGKPASFPPPPSAMQCRMDFSEFKLITPYVKPIPTQQPKEVTRPQEPKKQVPTIELKSDEQQDTPVSLNDPSPISTRPDIPCQHGSSPSVLPEVPSSVEYRNEASEKIHILLDIDQTSDSGSNALISDATTSKVDEPLRVCSRDIQPPTCHLGENSCLTHQQASSLSVEEQAEVCTFANNISDATIVVYAPPGHGKTTLLQQIHQVDPEMIHHIADTDHSKTVQLGRRPKIVFTNRPDLLDCGASLVIKLIPSRAIFKERVGRKCPNQPLDVWYDGLLASKDPPATLRVTSDLHLSDFLQIDRLKRSQF